MPFSVPSTIEIPRVYNSNRKVVKDGSLTITCPARGVPTPKITWYRYKDGLEVELTDFKGIKITKDGKELTIVEAKEEDSARYVCRAKNVAGQSEIAYNVAVQGAFSYFKFLVFYCNLTSIQIGQYGGIYPVAGEATL